MVSAFSLLGLRLLSCISTAQDKQHTPDSIHMGAPATFSSFLCLWEALALSIICLQCFYAPKQNSEFEYAADVACHLLPDTEQCNCKNCFIILPN